MTLRGGEVEVLLPGKKGEWGHIIANKLINDVVGGFNGTRSMMKARFPLDALRDFKLASKAKLFAPGEQYADFEKRVLENREEDRLTEMKVMRG